MPKFHSIEPGSLSGRAPAPSSPVDDDAELLKLVAGWTAKEMRDYMRKNPGSEAAINKALAKRSNKND